MPRLCSKFRSCTTPTKVASATASPPKAITRALPRNAWIYGAAERIHCTNARSVAELDVGLIRGTWGIGARGGTEGGSDYTVGRHGHGGKEATSMRASLIITLMRAAHRASPAATGLERSPAASSHCR